MEVRLFATLREGRGKVIDATWHDGMDGAALLMQLGISPDEVAILLVNGVHSKLDTQIHADDVIALFPPIGGG